MDPVFNAVQQNLDSMLGVPFVSSSVVLGLAFYGYKAGPELPSFVEELFENLFFKIFVGFMVLFMTTQNVMLSLVVSFVFVYGLDMLKENFCNILGKEYVPGDQCINQHCDKMDNMTGGGEKHIVTLTSCKAHDPISAGCIYSCKDVTTDDRDEFKKEWNAETNKNNQYYHSFLPTEHDNGPKHIIEKSRSDKEKHKIMTYKYPQHKDELRRKCALSSC